MRIMSAFLFQAPEDAAVRLVAVAPRRIIMSLQSRLYKGDPRLEACLIHDPAHIKLGAIGEHVWKIQMALILLDDLPIDSHELREKAYGPSTAAAVLAFKKKRNIINWTYQTQADNIVGKMTIAALDKEIRQWEQETPTIAMGSCACPRLHPTLHGWS
jgi:hypothetical protein